MDVQQPPQQKAKPKSAITTYGGGCVLLFFGFAAISGMISSCQNGQSQPPTQVVLTVRQRQERAAARKRAAVAEREKTIRAKEQQTRKAAQAKREREAEERKAQEVVVENSAYDGAVPQVVDYLKQTLRDFDSAEWIEWSPVEKFSGKPYKFRVRCKYRAENGFGGKTIVNQIFLLDSEGQVINVLDLE